MAGRNTAMIGLFMVDIRYQGKGKGTAIIDELMTVLKRNNLEKARIGVDKGNPQSYAFWKRNQFKTVSQDIYMIMERYLQYHPCLLTLSQNAGL